MHISYIPHSQLAALEMILKMGRAEKKMAAGMQPSHTVDGSEIRLSPVDM